MIALPNEDCMMNVRSRMSSKISLKLASALACTSPGIKARCSAREGGERKKKERKKNSRRGNE
jgi:hypothetical protein